MAKPLYTRQFAVRTTEAMAKRIERAALDAEQPPATWLRDVARKAVEAHEKRRQREAAK